MRTLTVFVDGIGIWAPGIEDWAAVLPTQSVCLTVPVTPPSEQHERAATRQRSDARNLRAAELKAGETQQT